MNKKLIFLSIAIIGFLVVLFYFLNLGSIIVKAYPEDSLVKINGRTYQSNKEIKLSPGNYTITVSREGFLDYSFSDVQIERAKTTEIKRILATKEEGDLQKNLPYDDGLSFKISLLDDGEKYIYEIGLYSFLNRDSQLARHEEEIRALRKEALNFIKNHQVSPDKIHINWLQKEAEDQMAE